MVLFLRMQEKRKYCMSLGNEVETCFSKINFVYSKESYLNIPGSYTPLCCSLFSSTSAPSSLHAGKMKCSMSLVNEVEIDFSKIDFVDSKGSYLNILVS